MIEKEIKLSYHEYEELVKINKELGERIEKQMELLKSKENVVVLENISYRLGYNQYINEHYLHGSSILEGDEAKEHIAGLVREIKYVQKQIEEYNEKLKFRKVKKKWWYKLFKG